jgi:hypothetical protein
MHSLTWLTWLSPSYTKERLHICNGLSMAKLHLLFTFGLTGSARHHTLVPLATHPFVDSRRPNAGLESSPDTTGDPLSRYSKPSCLLESTCSVLFKSYLSFHLYKVYRRSWIHPDYSTKGRPDRHKAPTIYVVAVVWPCGRLVSHRSV